MDIEIEIIREVDPHKEKTKNKEAQEVEEIDQNLNHQGVLPQVKGHQEIIEVFHLVHHDLLVEPLNL